MHLIHTFVPFQPQKTYAGGKRMGSYDPLNENLHYFVGESNINQQSVSGQYFKRMAVGLLIDVETSIILDVNITMISNVAKNFVSAQMIGRNVLTESNEILCALTRYHSSTQKSIVAAFKQAVDCYQKWYSTRLQA